MTRSRARAYARRLPPFLRHFAQRLRFYVDNELMRDAHYFFFFSPSCH